MRNKILSAVIITAFAFTAISCGVMRSLGLYNVPPPYSETYEEYFHKKCIDHPNSKENIRIKIRPVKETFSPYEKIGMNISVINNSVTDTMYVYSVDIGNLFIVNSFNRPVRILESQTSACPWIIVNDEYGRRLISTILSAGLAIPPKDSLYKTVNFITGLRLPDAENFPDPVISRATFQRENSPGIYQVVLISKHEEFDEQKGLVDAGKMYSDTVQYIIRNYNKDEMAERNDILNIIKDLQQRKPRETTDSLISTFTRNHSESNYIKEICEYQKLFYHIDSVRTAKANSTK